MDSVDLLLLPTVASAGVYIAMVGGFLGSMLARPRSTALPERCPRVSILKPLSGLDDELERNLTSFVNLDYPDYEILLGVSSTDDPAYPTARNFVRRLGERRARLLITDPNAALNPKVAQLLALERAARGEVLVISDSNVCVTRDYLAPLVAELARPGVALVSSVIAGTGEQSLGAALENLQLGALVAPGVVASTRLTGHAISVGKSMAISRSALAEIGGFARVGHLLSEDHMLGIAFQKAGFTIEVSLVPVENRNVTCSLRRTIERHTRWAKMRRAISPPCFFLEPLLSPLTIASLTALVMPSRSLAALFLGIAVLQIAGAFITTRVLRGSAPKWYWIPLELVRSYLLFFCWLRACFSRRVSWRGHHFELMRGSEIVPAQPSIWSRMRPLVRA